MQSKREELKARLKQAIAVTGGIPSGISEDALKEEVAEKAITLVDFIQAAGWEKEESTLVALGMVVKVHEHLQGVQAPVVKAINFGGKTSEEVKRIYDEGGSLE
jgi:mannitol/fructose-specific phosphotransferase system IIA component